MHQTNKLDKADKVLTPQDIELMCQSLVNRALQRNQGRTIAEISFERYVEMIVHTKALFYKMEKENKTAAQVIQEDRQERHH